MHSFLVHNAIAQSRHLLLASDPEEVPLMFGTLLKASSMALCGLVFAITL